MKPSATPTAVEVTGARVLVVDTNLHRRRALVAVLARLGHEVIAPDVATESPTVIGTQVHPDIAVVAVSAPDRGVLRLIEELTDGDVCAVVAVMPEPDRAFIREAARRGLFALVVRDDPDELQHAIDIALERFVAYRGLRSALQRRAEIEQAKGILMCRHRVTAQRAFDLLREHSQREGRKVADLAKAVVDSHLLLLPPAAAGDDEHTPLL